MEQVKLPENYSYSIVNVIDELTLEIIPFLNKNYGNTGSNYLVTHTLEHFKFYFKDSPFDFIAIKKDDVIIGTIAGKVTKNLVLNGESVEVYEINYLCIDFKYRHQALRDYLIAEVYRCGKIHGLELGFYISKLQFSGEFQYKPLSKINYYNYYANPMLLHDLKYITVPKGISKIANFLNKKTHDDYNIDASLVFIKNKPIDTFMLGKLNEKYSKYKLSYKLHADYFNSKCISTFTFSDQAFISYYHIDLVHTDEKDYKIKQAYVLYYWCDKDISLETLFKTTMKLVTADLIICNDTDELTNESLRIKLKMNNEKHHTYYGMFGMDDPIKIKSKDIGVFIP